ncbi:MAG TPA: adenylate/guanylate cyclase domain-containing protein [Burkholderiales bacterium]|nr:adenylate/guanylate cyclase domain-containing protein [Burkholderiales bacterium]
MTDPLLRDALRLIQDIVMEAKGSSLDREAVRRVEEVLSGLAAPETTRAADTGYSRREATILFADLRGFSAIAEKYPPDVVLGVLSSCFGQMTEIIVRHYGTIDKFMGDAIMVVFHGENPSPRDHVQRALLCAVEMQIAMVELRKQHRQDGLPEVYLGIGISTGTVMAGLIGSDAYRAYTVIGEEVNLAARIEAFSLRGQVLMSEATYAHCREFVRAGEPMEVYVKGRSERLHIREALGIPELGKVVPRQEVRKSPRVAVDLTVQYQPLAGKMVEGRPLMGRVRDLGYHGALVEFADPLLLHTEVKLAFHLPRLEFRAEEIYARIVSRRDEDGRHLAGVEFTSLPAEASSNIQLFVQMCIQGEAGT